jgi:hypothetical protein
MIEFKSNSEEAERAEESRVELGIGLHTNLNLFSDSLCLLCFL